MFIVFLKFAKNPLLSRDQLLLALEKKKLCNAKALSVVQYCIDTVESEADFIDKLKHINQCHYDDIVEERSIIKLCGYPLCKLHLTEYVCAHSFTICSYLIQ